MLAEHPITFVPFDINQWTNRYRSRLPQWRQEGVTYFATFRMADSIPLSVFEKWQIEKFEWLRERNVHVPLPVQTDDVPQNLRALFKKTFNRKLHEYLDGCRGRCELRAPENRREIENRFQSVKCTVGSYVIMPNHVHVLVTPGIDQLSVEEALGFVKGGAAFAINQNENRKGPLFQKDNFTHIVRSPDALEKYQDYIENNPVVAGLNPGEYSFHRAAYDCL